MTKYDQHQPAVSAPKIGLAITELGFSYKDNVVFSRLSMTISRGQCEVVLGENGAGKSTLYSLILGLRKKDKGTISIGCDPQQIAYLPQILHTSPTLTVKEAVTLWASLERADPIQVWDSLHDRLPRHTKEKMLAKANDRTRRLSYGEMRLITLATLFALPGKRLFLLDEPTNGLDVSARATFWELIESREPDSTVLWSTHELGEVNELTNGIRLLVDKGSRWFCSLKAFAASEAETDAAKAFSKLIARSALI